MGGVLMTKNVVFSIASFLIVCIALLFASNPTAVFADSYQITSEAFPEIQDNDPSTTQFSDVTIANNILYVSNSKKQALIDYYNVSTETPSKSQLNIKDTYMPTQIEYNFFDQKLYFTAVDNPGIGVADSDNYIQQYYDESSGLNTPITIMRTFSFAISMNGTIFVMAQSHHNNDYIIIYKENDKDFFSLLVNLSELSSPITLANNSCITTDTYGKNIWFNDETTLYEYNIESGFQDISYNLPATYDQIIDMQMDFFENLYILTNSGLNQKSFIKSTKTTHEVFVDTENKITANGFAINFENGNIFTFSNTQIYAVSITQNDTSIFSSFNEISVDQTWKDATPNTVCTILNTTKQTMIYPFENLYKQGQSITQNTKLILLSTNENSMFNFVLINNGSETNIVGFVKKADCANVDSIEAQTAQVIPIFNRTTLYTYPTTLPCEQSNEVVLTTITCSSQNTAPVLVVLNAPVLPTDSNNVDFLAVRYGNIIGYIDKNLVIDATQNAIKRIFISNAKINESTAVYADFNLTTQSTSLDANTSIQVEKVEDGVAKIYWMNNNKIFVGYINTKFVNDGNLTTLQIIGIIIMAVAVLTTALVLIIRHSRHKKLKQKIEQTKQALDN